jgi:hypothetical protein
MRRGWLWGAGVAVVVAVLFAISTALYASSLAQQSPSGPVAVPAQGLVVTLLPERIDPATNSLVAIATVELDGYLADLGSHLMRRNLTVRITPALSGGVITAVSGGPVPGPQRVEIPVSGQVQQYPFDSYSATVSVVGNADGLGTIGGGFVGDRGLPGWSVQVTSPVDQAEGGVLEQSINLSRAGSTVLVSLLILGLMVVVAVVAICAVVAVSKRRDELHLMLASWFAALIFAVVPLRNFLPGGPPIGSWIDILVFFWVEVALIAVLSVYVVMWILARPADS